MALLTYIYADEDFNLLRARIVGVQIASVVDGLGISGRFISFTTNAGLITWQLAVDARFYPWSSNFYTLGFTMDADDSFAKIAGVEVPAGVLVSVDYVINEYEVRLILQPQALSGDPRTLDLPPAPADYWYPYSIYS